MLYALVGLRILGLVITLIFWRYLFICCWFVATRRGNQKRARSKIAAACALLLVICAYGT